jgi:hypothetical protein
MNFSTPAWLFANLAGAGAFLLVASQSWVEPELAQIPGAAGGSAVVWALSALPIFVGFVLLNLGVLVWVYLIRRGPWPIARVSFVALAVWLAAFVVDNMHHGT